MNQLVKYSEHQSFNKRYYKILSFSAKKNIVFFITLFFFLAASKRSAGQFYLDNLKSPKTPEVASMTQYGLIPVSLFEGKANIEIPIVSVSCGNINVPVSLMYNSAGNKVNQHPEWVGQGWTAIAGGMISRQINGRRDEEKRAIAPTSNYYDQRAAMGPNAPHSTSGSFDYHPDEFSFNVNGLYGSFYLNYDGEWKVKTKSNVKFKVESEITSNFNLSEIGYSNIPRAFTKFIVTADDGTQYIFGGDVKSMEFGFPMIPSINTFGTPDAWGEWITNNLPSELVETNAWYLRKIISTNGDVVTFDYSNEYYFNLAQSVQVNLLRSYDIPNGSLRMSEDEINTINATLLVRRYLTKITSNNSTSIEFSRSISNELPFQFLYNNFKGYNFDAYGYGLVTALYCKLDNITIKSGNNNLKNIIFEYIESPSERLKLTKIKFFNEQMTEINRYALEYKNKLLPAYNSGNEDHWGFYNGKGQWAGSSPPNSSAGQNYFLSREPDTSYMDAEILEKIIYPTGGYSVFEFEPHQVSSLIVQEPSISCVSLGNNIVAGGLRIKKISTYDIQGNVSEKQYLYFKNYPDTNTSSGVLSGYPNYYDEGSTSYQRYAWIMSQPSNFLNNTNGNHVTYSEVIEKEINNGYSLMKFSNHDNGYLDHEPFDKNYTGANALTSNSFVNKAFGSLQQERGLLLYKAIYKENNDLLKEEFNEYNNDPIRFNEYVRAQVRRELPSYIYSFYTIPLFIYNPYLKKKMTKDYNYGSVITQTAEYEYSINNILKPVKITLSNSKGENVINTYSYPMNYAGQSVYDSMVSKYMLSQVIENKTFNNNLSNELNSIKVDYDFFNVNQIYPHSFQKKKGALPYETRTSIDIYNDRGKPKSASIDNGAKTCYLYSYNNQHVIAEIRNTDYAVIENILGANAIENFGNQANPDKAAVDAFLLPLKANLSAAFISSYIYKPLVGITSMTDPKGMTTYYEYDEFQRLKHVKDQNGNILKSNTYHYKN